MKKILKKIRLQHPYLFSIVLKLSTFAIRFLSFRKRVKGRENIVNCSGALILKVN